MDPRGGRPHSVDLPVLRARARPHTSYTMDAPEPHTKRQQLVPAADHVTTVVPTELVLLVADHCDPESRVRIAATCKRMLALLREQVARDRPHMKRLFEEYAQRYRRWDMPDVLAPDVLVRRGNTTLNVALHKLVCNTPELDCRALASALVRNPGLHTCERLNVSCNPLGRGTCYITRPMRLLTALVCLDLDSCELGHEGAGLLSEALPSVTTLRSLGLNNNCIGDDGAASLSRTLTYLTALERLCLRRNYIGRKGAVKLSKALTCLTALELRDIIADNPIGNYGIKAFAVSITGCTHTTRLCLMSNEIGSIGALYLAIRLPSLVNLQYLSLANNSISDSGAERIASAAISLTGLKELDLSNNSIRCSGACDLGWHLQKCPTLQTLFLDRNRINTLGWTSLRQLTQLQAITLHYNPISQRVKNGTRSPNVHW